MDTSPSQEAQGVTKPGPSNPAAEGLDAPTPPGGPQRQDAARGPVSAGHDDEASAAEREQGGPGAGGAGTIPLEDEQPDPETSPGAGEPREGDAAQQDVQLENARENAQSSLDQPSEGVS